MKKGINFHTHGTIDANSSATVLAVDVQTNVISIYVSFITTSFGMSVTLALLADVGFRHCSLFPKPLIVQRTTSFAVITASVMAAFALRTDLDYTHTTRCQYTLIEFITFFLFRWKLDYIRSSRL